MPSTLRIGDIYGSGYLAAADLQPGRVYRAVIHDVRLELIGREDEERSRKLVLDLVGSNGSPWPKQVPLNRTNATALSEVFGDDAATWPGRAVELSQHMVQFAGRRVAGVKVVPAGAAAAAPPPPPPPPPPPSPRGGGSVLDDDDIPFGPETR